LTPTPRPSCNIDAAITVKACAANHLDTVTPTTPGACSSLLHKHNIRLIRESQHQNALDDYNSMVKPGLSWNAYLVNLDTKHDILFLQAVKKTSCHLWLTGKAFLQT
jgi:hypothetical protein